MSHSETDRPGRSEIKGFEHMVCVARDIWAEDRFFSLEITQCNLMIIGFGLVLRLCVARDIWL